MPATANIPTHPARYSIVLADLPGHGEVNLGVLLQDTASNSIRLRFRRDLNLLAQEEDLELLQALADDLLQKAEELGAERLFEFLESSLSAGLRITDREPVLVEDSGRAVERLYRRHVQTNVVPFKTHLPRYSLRAAAGKFLDNEEILEEGWVETPEDMRHLYPDMFVAEIVGQSMEPLIPDGSFCIFRGDTSGSRNGRLILAEDMAAHAYAVKRYRSEKAASEEGWQHKRIRLESINPGFPSWDLDPDEARYRIIAEFIRILD